MLSYNLNNQELNLTGDRLVNDIMRMISKIAPKDRQDLLLIVKLQKIVPYDGDSPLSKIEYKTDQ